MKPTTLMCFASSLLLTSGLATSTPNLAASTITPSTPTASCAGDFAAPVGGSGMFTADSSSFYHFSKLGPTDPTLKGKAANFHFGLHRVDLITFKAKLLISMKAPDINLLLMQGQPISGMIGVMMPTNLGPCHQGWGEYVGFPMPTPVHTTTHSKSQGADGKLPFIRGQGEFRVVAGPLTPYLYDVGRKSLLEFDFEKMQSRRRFIQLADEEVLLYSNPASSQKYTWQTMASGGRNRGLLAYDNERSIAGRMKFEGQDRLLQQGKLFGVLHSLPPSNSLELIELARWSGSNQTKPFRLRLPPRLEVSEAAVSVDFSNRLALVTAKTDEARKKWQQILLFDYNSGRQVTSYHSSKDEFVAYSALSPDGAMIAAELRSINTNQTLRFVVYNIATRKWITIPMAASLQPKNQPASKALPNPEHF